MRDLPRDGANMSSIDPDALQGAANQLKSTQDGINNDLYPLRSRFASLSVSTTHLDQLHRAAMTLDDYPSELKRRISLARAMVAENPGHGKIAYFSSDDLGAFKTTEEAQKQAKADAKAFKDADGGVLSDDQIKRLQKYGSDPDYAETLVKELGPGTLSNILRAHSIEDDGDTESEAHRALSTVLATASYRVTFDEAFFKKMQSDGDPKLPDPLNIFSEYATTAQFSEKSLHAMADANFNPKDYHGLNIYRRTTINILKALSNNPHAAATYFDKHHELLKQGSASSKYMYDGEAKAWADFFHTATVTARNEMALEYLKHPGDNPAIKNAEFMMKDVAKNGDTDYTHEMRVMFAQTAEEYMDDFQRTVGSSIDVGSVKDPDYDGASVGTADWQKFLKEGMEDNDGLGIIATSMSAHIKALQRDTAAAEQKSPTDNADATFWDDYATGAMQATFINLYGQVKTERGEKADKERENIKGWIDKGIGYITDPKGIPEDLLKEGAKELLGLAVDAAVKPEKMPDLPSGFSAKQDYANEAGIRLYNAQHGQTNKDKPFGVKPYDDGELKWDGDPKLYTEPSPPNGDFTKYLTKDGVDMDKLKNDHAAWATYDRYLRDPAVQTSIADGTKSQLIGELKGN